MKKLLTFIAAVLSAWTNSTEFYDLATPAQSGVFDAQPESEPEAGHFYIGTPPPSFYNIGTPNVSPVPSAREVNSVPTKDLYHWYTSQAASSRPVSFQYIAPSALSPGSGASVLYPPRIVDQYTLAPRLVSVTYGPVRVLPPVHVGTIIYR